MAYQIRSGSAAGGSTTPQQLPSTSTTSGVFRSTRNDLAATLKSSQTPIESRSSGQRQAQAFAANQSSLPTIPISQVARQTPSTSTTSTILAFSTSPSPPTSSYGTKPGSAYSKPSTASTAATTSNFPSVEKEETKEQQAAAASSLGGLAGTNKDKDWNLWHGAVEAQWILSVLDDISNKLTLASFLTPEILKDKICESIDPEMLLTLKEHFQVENQYHEFLDSDLWKLNSHEVKNQELFHELDLCLADSTRTVTRLLKQNPLLVRRLREVSGKRNPQTLDFINTFGRLRMLMHHKLRMTAEEERHMREQLQELRNLEEEDTHKFIELTERLAVERNEHEQALLQKDRKIQRLQQQIDQLQSRTTSERVLFEEKMREENDEAERTFKQTERELMKQLDALQHQLEVDGNENFRAELLYHRKKNLRALDVTNLIEKYDQDMTLKHESVVDMDAVYKKERVELDALTGYFEVRDEEERKIREEHDRIHEERDKELRVERRTQQAALLVQTLYKGYYAKNGPKEPKVKKAKKKKDPFAGLRGRPKKEAPPALATGGEAPGSPVASPTGELTSPLAIASPTSSGPEESEGEHKEVVA